MKSGNIKIENLEKSRTLKTGYRDNMNESMEATMWTIKHIFDGEYGCEERTPGKKPTVSVTLENEDGKNKIVSVEDDWLTENNLSEGSKWPE